MSSYHSTMTRRDFMKALGLTGAGLGVAAAAAPVFHDLDEVTASATGEWKRAWWIKEREHDDPTVELDWSMLKRLDHAKTRRGSPQYFSAEQKAAWVAKGTAIKDQIGWSNYTLPGKQLRDAALSDAARNSRGELKGSDGVYRGSDRHWGGPKIAKTPEERGVPKWTGSPEEATRMLRTAMIFFGAVSMYTGELNGKHRNLINATDRTKPILFDATISEGYDDGKKYVLPDRELWEIGYAIPESRELHRAGYTNIRSAANSSRYRMRRLVAPATQDFLRALGYICEGASAYPITPGNGAACLHGAAEQHRNNWWSIDVQLDPVVGRYELITDLPMEPCPPADAGIAKFCDTCGHCAEVCPSDSVSKEKERTWEPPVSPYTGITVAGHIWKKIHWTNLATCDNYTSSIAYGCELCRTACPFMTNRGALAHDLVRATVANTSVFNSFIATTIRVFGFGQVDDLGNLVGYTEENYARAAARGQSWWDMSLPTHGYDTTVFSADGGYRK